MNPQDSMEEPSQHMLIGIEFVHQYFSVWMKEPQSLCRFYDEQAFVSISLPESETIEASGDQERIRQALTAAEHTECNCELTSIDCQPSIQDSILVCSEGLIHRSNAEPLRFLRTFILAPCTEGYFVSNDVLRYTPLQPMDQEYAALDDEPQQVMDQNEESAFDQDVPQSPQQQQYGSPVAQAFSPQHQHQIASPLSQPMSPMRSNVLSPEHNLPSSPLQPLLPQEQQIPMSPQQQLLQDEAPMSPQQQMPASPQQQPQHQQIPQAASPQQPAAPTTYLSILLKKSANASQAAASAPAATTTTTTTTTATAASTSQQAAKASQPAPQQQQQQSNEAGSWGTANWGTATSGAPETKTESSRNTRNDANRSARSSRTNSRASGAKSSGVARPAPIAKTASWADASDDAAAGFTPVESSSSKSSFAASKNASNAQLSNAIFVRGIPSGVEEKELRDSFSQFGRISELQLRGDRSKRYAFIDFERKESAVNAASDGHIELSGGSRVQVEIKNPMAKRGPTRSRTDRSERPDRPERGDRPERTERTDRQDRTGQAPRKRGSGFSSRGATDSTGTQEGGASRAPRSERSGGSSGRSSGRRPRPAAGETGATNQ